MPKDKCVSLQESDDRQEWRLLRESDNGWADEDRCPRESLPTRIAVCKDPWGDNSCCNKCQYTCCHTYAWKHVGKTVGPFVAMLCVDMDTVHGCCKMTGLPLFCSTRSAEWSQEVEKAKTYRIGAKSKFSFNLFNLQAVFIYYCCAFNFVVNYPMIIITPCNWYCKNVQFSNRMTGHYSPESMV